MPAQNFVVEDLILDNWKNSTRGRWRTGRIVKVYHGSDGLVWAVDAELYTGILRRGTNQPRDRIRLGGEWSRELGIVLCLTS